MLADQPRKPRDVAVTGRPAPEANNGNSTISTATPAQEAAVQRYVRKLQQMGAEDIRVNQRQVDINGRQVGRNQPDLQFTYQGKRYYIEWDRGTSDRGIPHGRRIKANDPSGQIFIFTLG
jgi:hypothetical protein